MKKQTSLTLFLLLISFTVLGQDNLSVKPQERFGITLQLNSPNPDDINVGWFNIDMESIDGYNLKHKSYSLGGILQYDLDQETTIRIRFARTKIWIKEYNDFEYVPSTYGFEKEAYTGSQVKLQFAPGILWKFRYKKLELYAGFELPVNLHGKYTFTSSFTTLNQNKDFKAYAEGEVVLPKGHSFGIGALGGFNIYPAKNVSVGAEFSPSLLYAKLSGKTTNRTTKLIPEIPGYVFVPTHTEDANEGFTFYEQRFSLNVSYWFDL